MYRRVFITRAILVVTTFALLSQQIQGTDISFRITDYIPEKLVDFEWKVDGSTQLRGENRDQTRTDPFSSWLPRQEYDHNSRRWSTAFLTDAGYRYETVPEFLMLNATLGGSFSATGTDTTELTIYRTDDLWQESEDTDHSQRYWSIGFEPRFDAGKYLLGDFFVAMTGRLEAKYSETPKNRRITDRFQERDGDDHLVQKSHAVNDDRGDNKEYEVELALTPGWGRLYDGVYASTALYMIEELQAAGLLTRVPSHDEMLALTELVYQYRLKHAIDSRIRRIEALTEMMSYLESTGITENPGPYGHLVLQDVWDYFPRMPRRFGSQVRVGLGGEYDYSSQQSTDEYNTSYITLRYDPDTPHIVDTTLSSWFGHTYVYYKSKFRTVYLAAYATYHVPLSRKWQFEAGGSARYHLYSDREMKSLVTEHHVMAPSWRRFSISDWDYSDYGDVGLWAYGTYIVNSRTSLELLGRYDYSRLEYEWKSTTEDPSGTQKDKGSSVSEYWSLRLSTGLTYRLSIPTELWASVNYWHESPQAEEREVGIRESDDRSYDTYSINVSISHYLF